MLVTMTNNLSIYKFRCYHKIVLNTCYNLYDNIMLDISPKQL